MIGSIVQVVDSQASPAPALDVLASPDIDVVTLTVTEKGYCHKPSSGELDLDHPDIVHDLANPETPRSLPGLLARALELRHDLAWPSGHADELRQHPGQRRHPRQCRERDRRAARRRPRRNGSPPMPPSRPAMVDRIAPATSQADIDMVEQRFGYRDSAVVVGEPFRQWVIENRFAGRVPQWDLVGATLVDDVTPFEHLKMRVLNGAQSDALLSRRACRAGAYVR